MNKLLIYVGERQGFEGRATTDAIASINGVSRILEGGLIGAVWQCEYSFADRTTMVRISDDLETVSVGGLAREAVEFAVRLQQLLPERALRVIDTDYTFDLPLSEYETGAALMAAIEQV